MKKLALPLSIVEEAQELIVRDARGAVLVTVPFGSGRLSLDLARQTAKRSLRGLTQSQQSPRCAPLNERQAYRAAVKDCVQELHEEARRMNDEKARDMLNGAGFWIGRVFKPKN